MSENVKEVKKRGRKKKTEENTEETENVKKETSTVEIKEVKKRGRKPKTEKQEELENLNDIDEKQMERKGKEEKEGEGIIKKEVKEIEKVERNVRVSERTENHEKNG